MPLLTASNVVHRFGTRTILDGATLAIEPGEKIGLVGRNGSGKTTLMSALLGRLDPDGGTIQFQRGARVGYLSQHPDLDPDATVREAAAGAFAELADLHTQMNDVYDRMASADGDELERLMAQQARLEASIEAAGGYAVDHRIDAMLHGLGFTDDQFGLAVGKLSGGQKGRLGLARLLLEAPDLLLLDEPTNHLDIEGRRWLETFLADEYPGAVLVVSHDRWLLDRVVSRIVEVERGQVVTYPGNYAKYRELRLERQLTQARVYDKQRDRIRQEEQFIAKYKAGQRAKQARGRQSRLERYKRDELVERPIELNVMRLKLPEAPRSGEQVVTAEGLAKGYGEKRLFEGLDLAIARGDRIGIIGPNGVGKSTLIKCLLGELEPDAGETRLGSRVSVGYYRQLQEHLDLSLTVWQYLQSVIVSLDNQVKASEQQARDLAGAFLFSGAEQDKVLQDLSGGERSRAVLAGLVAGAHNLLVLDEPTNHLDIPSAERLEEALSAERGYTGSLLLISHDRALIESTCDQLLVFSEDRAPVLFQGRYSEWREREDARLAREASKPAAPRRGGSGSDGAGRADGGSDKGGGGGGGGKGRRGKRRGRSSEATGNPLSHLTVEQLEKEIERREARVAEIDALLCDPDVYGDHARCEALGAERGGLMAELEPLEFEWAGRAED